MKMKNSLDVPPTKEQLKNWVDEGKLCGSCHQIPEWCICKECTKCGIMVSHLFILDHQCKCDCGGIIQEVIVGDHKLLQCDECAKYYGVKDGK